MARAAARKLVGDMIGGVGDQPSMLPSMLVHRSSVAPPPPGAAAKS
jgi:hypothetical protein